MSPENQPLEFVIARHDECLDWTKALPGLLTVYDKGAPHSGQSIRLPNAGRESATYLSHIVERYHSLAEVTVFCQGDTYTHASALLSRLKERAGRFGWLTDSVFWCDWDGAPHHPGLPLEAVWNGLLAGHPRPPRLEFGPGAIFFATRDAILGRGRDFYRAALELHSSCESAPWVFERLWKYVFTAGSHPPCAKGSNSRVVAVTPAGRRRYLEILTRHTGTQRGLIDRHELWLNTENLDDLAWIRELCRRDPFFVAVEPGWPVRGNFSIAPFFTRCIDQDTLYVRLDDDIVYLAPDALREIVDFRVNHPEYLLVFGNVINNAVVTHILQRLGIVSTAHGCAGYACMDHLGWQHAHFAEWLHRSLLADIRRGTVDRYKMPMWDLMYAREGRERVSINFICWSGADFRSFNGVIGEDEEAFLNGELPQRLRRSNAICGTAIAAHFAFYTQREYLDQSDLLSQYRSLVFP